MRVDGEWELLYVVNDAEGTLNETSNIRRRIFEAQAIIIRSRLRGVERFCLNNGFLILKPTRCTKFSNFFWNETLHVSDSSSVHRQEFFTVHTAMVYVIQVC